ncbi:hypothetical protein F4561_002093 [Lipingzhangella halophila]|uniref:HNH endonuclease n=1 Tax=Lipingzhangella halophila TaxID=1783352 RepID=A0A7W7W2B6_9ACTN|nr:HNH endonuclease signature motif containing protein [Lipingzhangella halophila]MBB4931273.1 hypothetical protein [Lipingzhangella halophila]
MGIKDLTDRSAVLNALARYDDQGRDAFLGEAEFGAAKRYFLQHNGKLYEAKAIAGAAYRIQFPDREHLEFSGGKEHANAALEAMGFTVVDRETSTLEEEFAWRIAVWEHLKATHDDLRKVEPTALRAFGAYGGAQGVWVDTQRTSKFHGEGVTVGILHPGVDYPDEVSDEGVFYHYPVTKRPAQRDRSEVAATQAAGTLQLPIFVITKPTPSSTVRAVQLGWVSGWDDDSKQFLIDYGDHPPDELITEDQSDEEPFVPVVSQRTKKHRAVMERSDQNRFKLKVLKRYGSRCPLSGVTVPQMIEAAHLIPHAKNGTSDPRNGLPLNVALHRAFDANLFAIDPETLDVVVARDGPSIADLGIITPHLHDLAQRPHRKALEWRYNEWKRRAAPPEE